MFVAPTSIFSKVSAFVIAISFVVSWDSCMAQQDNYVMSFDGDDKITVDSGSVLAGVRTIEFWVKFDNALNSNLSETVGIIVRNTTGCNSCNEVAFAIEQSNWTNPGKMRFSYANNQPNSKQDITSDQNSWNADQWYHIAGVVHPTQGMMLFVDGVKQQDTNMSATAAIGEAEEGVNFGCWCGVNFNRFLTGQLDDVRFSTTALYTDSLQPGCPTLPALQNSKGLWNFNDQATSLSAYDSTGNEYNGQIFGAAYMRDTICVSTDTVSGDTNNSDSTNNDSTNSVTYLRSDAKISLYPNPTSSTCTLRCSIQNASFDLLDITGRVVMSGVTEGSETQIEVHQLQQGIYIFQVREMGRMQSTSKLVLER